MGNTKANSRFVTGGVSCRAVRQLMEVKDSSVFRMNICCEKPAHRQSANRHQ